jgi:glutaredoxin-related protein
MNPSFETPQENGYTIYTKSNCSYCEKAKSLLEKEKQTPKIIPCDVYLQSHREPFLEFIQTIAKKEHKTFPMVFNNGVFIGGMTETAEYHKKQSVEWHTLDFL